MERLQELKEAQDYKKPDSILDVGCGANPQGTINTDLFRITEHLTQPHTKTNAEIICDAEHLPFPNDSFDVVRASHVIEHVDSPTYVLHELLRVAKREVRIICPHRFSHTAKWKGIHKQFLNRTFFYSFAKKNNLKLDCETKYKPLAGLPLTLMRPYEIYVTFYKNLLLK